MFEYLHQINTNYTKEMYDGMCPARKGHEHVDGGFCDHWKTAKGSGESYRGKIINASYQISETVNVFVTNDLLWIVKIPHSATPKVWEYSSDYDRISMTNMRKENIHRLTDEEVQKIFAKKDDSLFWKMIKEQALEIYNKTGDYNNERVN